MNWYKKLLRPWQEVGGASEQEVVMMISGAQEREGRNWRLQILNSTLYNEGTESSWFDSCRHSSFPDGCFICFTSVFYIQLKNTLSQHDLFCVGARNKVAIWKCRSFSWNILKQQIPAESYILALWASSHDHNQQLIARALHCNHCFTASFKNNPILKLPLNIL